MSGNVRNEIQRVVTLTQHLRTSSDELVTVDLPLACAGERAAGREYCLDPTPNMLVDRVRNALSQHDTASFSQHL